MDVIYPPETSVVFQRTTRRYIAEDIAVYFEQDFYRGAYVNEAS
jgi:hypothetical protein